MNSTQLHSGEHHMTAHPAVTVQSYSDLALEPVMQMTLASPVRCSGVALHSGDTVTMVIRPAPVSTGIVFYRSDVGGEQGMIPARYDARAGKRHWARPCVMRMERRLRRWSI